MARHTFVVRPVDGVMTLIPKDEAPTLEVARSAGLPTPMLSLDGMDPTLHPVDQQHYTSKSAFRAVTKAHGYTEVGNDPARLRPRQKPKPDRAAIRESLQKAAARVRAGERV